jgi:MoaA/NifB/PqqE/SkfB family radical SAM enzyme
MAPTGNGADMYVVDYRYGSSIPKLMHRHLRGMLRGATVRKATNALIFLAEKTLHTQKVHSQPLYIKIEPTNVCDHACPECPSLTDRPKGFMDFGLYQEIINFYKGTCLRNCLYGQGESFLHPDVFKMISYSEVNRCPVSISSNYNNMNEEKIRRLLDSGLNYLIVCIDGATQETHSYFRRKGSLDKVLKNLEMTLKLKAQGGYKYPRIEIQTIHTDRNEAEMDAITAIGRKLGVDMQTIRYDNNILNRTVREDGHETCPYLWGSIFITWDGKVCFCEVDYIGSDLIMTDFESVAQGENYWNSDRIKYARSLFSSRCNPQVGDQVRCAHCKFFPIPTGKKE